MHTQTPHTRAHRTCYNHYTQTLQMHTLTRHMHVYTYILTHMYTRSLVRMRYKYLLVISTQRSYNATTIAGPTSFDPSTGYLQRPYFCFQFSSGKCVRACMRTCAYASAHMRVSLRACARARVRASMRACSCICLCACFFSRALLICVRVLMFLFIQMALRFVQSIQVRYLKLKAYCSLRRMCPMRRASSLIAVCCFLIDVTNTSLYLITIHIILYYTY